MDLFDKKVMDATKKTSKINIAGEMFLTLEINLFFSECFLSPEINCFFLRNRQQSNAHSGQNKNTCFVCNAPPKSNARAQLKQRKKHSGLQEDMKGISVF